MDALARGLIDAVNGVLWNDALIVKGAFGLEQATGALAVYAVSQAVAIFFLAFSSMTGNDAYAEGNVEFITKRRGALPADVWGEHGPLPQRSAAAAFEADAVSGMVVRRS
ncbi:protein of unknown function [Burkholderia multivorans]